MRGRAVIAAAMLLRQGVLLDDPILAGKQCASASSTTASGFRRCSRDRQPLQIAQGAACYPALA
jgi:hypothetical protein